MERRLTKQVRKQLIISTELDQRLISLAEDSGTSAAKIVVKALELYVIAATGPETGVCAF